MALNFNDYDILEYVYANGKQYVNTSITPQCFGKIELCGRMMASGKNQTIWSARNNTQTTMSMFYLSNDAFRMDYGNNDSSTSYSYSPYSTFIIMQDANVLRVNGTPSVPKDPLSFTVPNPITFFNAYGSSQSTPQNAYAYMYFYWCRVYNNQNKLQAYFVPVRQKSTGYIGLYDTVNNTFQKSSSGTELIASEHNRKITLSTNLNGNDLAFQECEYITTNGSSYVDLGKKPTTDTKIEITEQYTTLSGNMINGCYAGDSQRFHFGFYNSAFHPGIGNGALTTPAWNTSKNTVVLDVPNNRMTIKPEGGSETSYNVGATSKTMPNLNIYIGARNDNGTANFYTNTQRIYRVKIYTGSTLSNDYIPCFNKYAGVVCLYDRVNDRFYSFSGTPLVMPKTDLPLDNVAFNSTKLTKATFNGTTIWQPKYRPLACLKTTGAQYINTYNYPLSTKKVELDEQYTSLVNDSMFGCMNDSGYRFHLGWWNNTFHAGLYNGYDARVAWNTNRNKVVLDAPNSRMQINGTNYPASGWTSPPSSSTMPGVPIMVGARNGSSSPTCYSNYQKIFKVVIWDSGYITNYFIPVLRLSDNKPGLLNIGRISAPFYTTGTGTDFNYEEQ